MTIFINESFFSSPPPKYKMAASPPPLFSTSLFCSFLASRGVSSQKIKHTSSDARPRKFCSPAKTTAIVSLFLATLSFPSRSQPCPCCAGADYENLREHGIRQCKVRAWRFNFTGHYPTYRQGRRSNVLLGQFSSAQLCTLRARLGYHVVSTTKRGTHKAPVAARRHVIHCKSEE